MQIISCFVCYTIALHAKAHKHHMHKNLYINISNKYSIIESNTIIKRMHVMRTI